MKTKLSITIDEETLRLIEKLAEEARFRNKSHVVEYSVNKLLDKEKER